MRDEAVYRADVLPKPKTHEGVLNPPSWVFVYTWLRHYLYNPENTQHLLLQFPPKNFFQKSVDKDSFVDYTTM